MDGAIPVDGMISNEKLIEFAQEGIPNVVVSFPECFATSALWYATLHTPRVTVRNMRPLDLPQPLQEMLDASLCHMLILAPSQGHLDRFVACLVQFLDGFQTPVSHGGGQVDTSDL